MNYKKLTILVDMDSIVANLQEKWYAAYNEEWDDNIGPDDIMSWETHLYVKPECRKKIYSYFTPELFRSLNPIPGSVATLKKWVEMGHEVVFVTATPWGCADAKFEWAREHFPFLTSHEIIMAHRKYLVHGDVFIDDSPGNIAAYRHHHGNRAKIFTIAYPYNQKVEHLCDLRLGSWNNPEVAWRGFAKAVDKLAKTSFRKYTDELPETD